jgi:glycosyltransferase 2 family protein
MDKGRSTTKEGKDNPSSAWGTVYQTLGVKKSWGWLLIASILLSLAVPFILGGFHQFSLLNSLPWWAALLLALLAFISWGFNALRTRMLMRALGLKISFRKAALTTIAAEFAGVATPASVGMAATYTFLFHNLGVTIGEAVGLVSIIMLTDVTFFGSTMILAMAAQFFGGGAGGLSLGMVAPMLAVIAGGAAVIVLLIVNFRRVYHFVSRQMAKVSWLARRRYSLAKGTVHFLRAARALQTMSWLQLITLFLITVGFWLPRYLVLIVVIYLVGAHIPFAYLILIQGVLNLGGQLFVIPAGGGVVDTAYVAFLSPYLSPEPLAFTLLVWRTYTFYWYLIIGGPIFLYEAGQATHNLLSQQE